MINDQKNMILAIGLSVLVIIGWQYFIGGPQLGNIGPPPLSWWPSAAPRSC